MNKPNEQSMEDRINALEKKELERRIKELRDQLSELTNIKEAPTFKVDTTLPYTSSGNRIDG